MCIWRMCYRSVWIYFMTMVACWVARQHPLMFEPWPPVAVRILTARCSDSASNFNDNKLAPTWAILVEFSVEPQLLSFFLMFASARVEWYLPLQRSDVYQNVVTKQMWHSVKFSKYDVKPATSCHSFQAMFLEAFGVLVSWRSPWQPFQLMQDHVKQLGASFAYQEFSLLNLWHHWFSDVHWSAIE